MNQIKDTSSDKNAAVLSTEMKKSEKKLNFSLFKSNKVKPSIKSDVKTLKQRYEQVIELLGVTSLQFLSSRFLVKLVWIIFWSFLCF